MMMMSLVIFALILVLTKVLAGNYWYDNMHEIEAKRNDKTGVLNNDQCNNGKCTECVCPLIVEIDTCNYAYYTGMRYCRDTGCFCIIGSTTGVGYNGLGTSKCYNSPMCCKDC